jgi:hypothetical protein
MKRILLFAVAACALLLQACNTKSKPQPQDGIFIEDDSIYMVNDSTIADAQTFIFEGTSPMNGNAIADVVLAVSTVNLNSDGTYTITTDYVDEGIATQTDNGEALILVGMNDSTATVIELVSSNKNPTMSFMMTEDSSLVKVDKSGKPVTKNPNHKLKIKK